MAKNSPLSRWASQPVLKNLRFRLSLDDPKLPQEQWVTLKGDRSQLERLCEAVTTYVQQFLQSHQRFNFTAASVNEAPIAVLPTPLTQSDAVTPIEPDSGGIRLQPRGLLSHELSLGSLATEESGPAVRLSSLQLFDLANALDDYTSDVMALPELQRSGWLKSTPAWGQIAAISLVMIGLSASLVKLFDNAQPTTNQAAAPTTSQGASSSDQRIATQLPDATSNPDPALSSQKLPPPPPLGSTVPASPGVPTVNVPQTTAKVPQATAPSGKVSPPSTIALQPNPNNRNQTTAIPQESAASTRAKVPQVPSQPTVLQAPSASTSSEAAGIASARQSMASAPETARGTADQAEPGTAFDTIPQVGEARSYFEQRWSPPEGLSQTLEYTLSVNPDGTIQRISPLGQAAGDYVDRTGIPLVGEPFVSAIKGGRSAKIRVVLSPDGKVQTFLEGVE